MGMNNFTSRPKVTVVGCGHWGKNIVRNLAALGALGAVADKDTARAATLADNYGVPAVSIDEALNGDAHRALAIATPVVTHGELVGAALQAGKDVFVEKPLSLTRAEAEALLKTARENNRILMVGHLLRYHPAYMKLLEQVNAGAIGRVRHIAAHRLHYWPAHPDESVLADLAPHDLAMIDGIIPGLPDEVAVRGYSYLQEPNADIAKVLLHYGKVSAHLYLSRLNPYKEHRFTVLGETGALVFDDSKNWDEKLVLSRPEGTAVHQAIALEMDEPLGREMKHFITCLETRAEPLTGGEHALRVSTILEQLLNSSSPLRGRCPA
jgi:predicted dehydrogenase